MSNRKRVNNIQTGIQRRRREDMPTVQPTDAKVVAILLADLHLSLKPPVWRSAEPDWLGAMKRTLIEIRALWYTYEECPIICAGDIFDRWDSKPELVNWALENLPDNIYAIPGQHDLPLHNYEDLHRSAYQTLVKAGKIRTIGPGKFGVTLGKHEQLENDIVVAGFPFGYKIEPVLNREKNKIHVAVVHQYAWIPGCSYPGAPAEGIIQDSVLRGNKWKGYDVVMYGDNHKGFLTHSGRTTIFNCGTLMRRKSDEIDYRSQVGLLLSTGEVSRHFLDISKDKHLDADSGKVTDESELDMSAFIEELVKLGVTELDFVEAMKQWLAKNKPGKEISDRILKAMEG